MNRCDHPDDRECHLCGRETYWGEPTTDDEHQLVEDCQRNMLYGN